MEPLDNPRTEVREQGIFAMNDRRQESWGEWIDRNHLWPRAVVATAIGMLGWVTWWSTLYANSKTVAGADVALVIAAVQVPASFYAKWAFETYKDIIK